MSATAGDRPPPPSGERIFIGMGSNLGDRTENLCAARDRIAALPGTDLVACSRFHATEPWGFADQPEFLNAVVEVRSSLDPEALLDALKQIERHLGRRETFRWGPRKIDLDLLLYGERRLSTDRLTLPHPLAASRPFVMAPLAEIAPDVAACLSTSTASGGTR